MQQIISIKNGQPRMPEWRMAKPVDFELVDGEHVAIIGPNGGGKSMLVDIITGSHPLLGDGPEYDFYPSCKEFVSDNIKYITFKDSYGDNNSTYFLQQRWNQQEIDENIPTVGTLLEEACRLSPGDDNFQHRCLQSHLYKMFSIEHIWDKCIILLSSGELRKFQIIKALLSNPRVLIMDNPFIGLDIETREQLKKLLQTLSEEQALQIIIVLSKADDLPDFITHVVEVKNMIVSLKLPKNKYLSNRKILSKHILSSDKIMAIKSLPYKKREYYAENVIKMHDVTIKYGGRVILDKLCWNVKNEERWALEGRNGSGKSTLLSLICADNPQSYACDIELFGYKRGSGESIWDIKKHIGYVSPEMHRAYSRNIPAIRIVASGFTDSVGLYFKPTESEYEICRWWMNIFGLSGNEDMPFLKLSSGEQRLVLLARAFVKDPELLILDEPLHGLDDRNRCLVKDIIEAFCQRKNKTMIMVSHYEEELPDCISHRLTLTRHI